MADLSRAFPSISEIATLLAPITNPELAKGYSSQPPLWRPLTRRTDRTYFGRKRRARRARGRRIEARRNRPGLLTVAQWAAAHRTMQRQRGEQTP